MTDQEMIDAIDAEIAEVDSVLAGFMLEGFSQTMETAYHKGYVNGLCFARDLIVKRMEGGK